MDKVKQSKCLKLEAAPELDRLVLLALGYLIELRKWIPASSADRGQAYFVVWPSGETALSGGDSPDKAVLSFKQRYHTGFYSTSIADAIGALDSLKDEKGGPIWYCAVKMPQYDQERLYSCSCAGIPNPVLAPTLPLAICRAILWRDELIKSGKG